VPIGEEAQRKVN